MMRNLERPADGSFRDGSDPFAFLEGPVGKKQRTSEEERNGGAEKSMPRTAEQKELNCEHLTATYWG